MELPGALHPFRHVIAGTCRDETCDRILIPRPTWRRIPLDVRRTLRAAGAVRAEARQLCETHFTQHCDAGTLDQFPQLEVRPDTVELLSQFNELTEDVGPVDAIKILAGQRRQSYDALLRRLRRNGVTTIPDRASGRAQKRDELLEEVLHFHSCGRGVAETARAVGLTPEQLVARIADWCEQGRVTQTLVDDWSLAA